MKKSIFITVLGMGAAAVAYGQGQVNFSNYNDPHQANGITYANGPAAGLGVGPEISVELLYSTDTGVTDPALMSVLASSLTAVGWNGVTQPGPMGTAFGSYAGTGVFNGGAVTVPGTAGSTYAFALYAFGTYQGVNYTGYSGIFTGTTQATSTAQVPNLPAGLFAGSFAVAAPVPEPTTLALAGLGGFGMFMALRRKKAI